MLGSLAMEQMEPRTPSGEFSDTLKRLVLSEETLEVLSQTEICSGIIEIDDVRQITQVVTWSKQGRSPSDICSTRGLGSRYKWTDICGVSFRTTK